MISLGGTLTGHLAVMLMEDFSAVELRAWSKEGWGNRLGGENSVREGALALIRERVEGAGEDRMEITVTPDGYL